MVVVIAVAAAGPAAAVVAANFAPGLAGVAARKVLLR